LKRRAEGIEPKPRGVRATAATPRPTQPVTRLTKQEQLILKLTKVRGLKITKSVPVFNYDPNVYDGVRNLASALGWTVSVCSNRLLALILSEYGLLNEKETAE